MQRIFLAPEQIQDGLARITGTDHLHMARVLRTRVGESIVVLDGQGNAFRAELVTIGKNESAARLVESVPVLPEPSVHIKIVQALGKGDKFEQVVQHGTEAGASSFMPLRAERCVVDIPLSKQKDRLARWQQIAKSAAEQSGRSIQPFIDEVTDFNGLVRKDASAKPSQEASVDIAVLSKHPGAHRYICAKPLIMLHTKSAATPLKQLLTTMPIPYFLALAIGPEGGWSPAELKAAKQANIPLVSLGPRVLRTETAALVAISQILYHFDMV